MILKWINGQKWATNILKNDTKDAPNAPPRYASDHAVICLIQMAKVQVKNITSGQFFPARILFDSCSQLSYVTTHMKKENQILGQ